MCWINNELFSCPSFYWVNGYNNVNLMWYSWGLIEVIWLNHLAWPAGCWRAGEVLDSIIFFLKTAFSLVTTKQVLVSFLSSYAASSFSSWLSFLFLSFPLPSFPSSPLPSPSLTYSLPPLPFPFLFSLSPSLSSFIRSGIQTQGLSLPSKDSANDQLPWLVCLLSSGPVLKKIVIAASWDMKGCS